MHMMKSNLLMKVMIFVCPLSLIGCGESDVTSLTETDSAPVSDDATNDTTTENATIHTLTHNDIDREFLLYIPNSYDGASAVPLLLNFHGFGGDINTFIDDADMRTLSEAHSFILVYPQGSLLNGISHWNACPIGGDNKSNADDFGFVEALIDDISSQYYVDQERIYVTGYSNGGMMAYGLANYKSELIAAAASVSGAMLECTSVPSHPMPILHLHGTQDSVIPYDGNTSYASVQTTLKYWIDFNNTSRTPTVSEDASGSIPIEHYTYEQGINGVTVEHYKYIGGEHIWFTEAYEGKNASELIWDFVSKYDVYGFKE